MSKTESKSETKIKNHNKPDESTPLKIKPIANQIE